LIREHILAGKLIFFDKYAIHFDIKIAFVWIFNDRIEISPIPARRNPYVDHLVFRHSQASTDEFTISFCGKQRQCETSNNIHGVVSQWNRTGIPGKIDNPRCILAKAFCRACCSMAGSYSMPNTCRAARANARLDLPVPAPTPAMIFP
jgi:hypothetical protein